MKSSFWMAQHNKSRVGFVLGTLLLGFGMLFWASGDDEDEPDIPRQDIVYPEDKGSCDPGTPENGCGGYGYGGECPTDEQAIDCSKSPCVFGKCTKAASGNYCDCFEGYDGRLCDQCAEGYKADNLRCVKEGE